MNISSIIIVPKMSKYELDMHNYKLSYGELIAKYRQEGIDEEKILSSHERQKKSREELRRLFNRNQFVAREELTKESIADADLVIALGGDNHFQYVSHFIDSSLIMGINSDPSKSEGVLTYFTTSNFESVLKKLEKNDFSVEDWIRLSAELNGYPVEMAVSEFYLGEKYRKGMSRHILQFNGQTEEQKSSGLLVSTGVGSTGWYDSACGYIYSNGNKKPKTDRRARFLVTEPYRGKLTGYSIQHGVLREGDKLIIHSLNDDGIVSSDSIEDYKFNRGAKAVITISDKPLKVVRMM
ncbi:MAG: hypothetical protein V1802_00580 [Candidatus Aenigmatarchaeota archaeon]